MIVRTWTYYTNTIRLQDNKLYLRIAKGKLSQLVTSNQTLPVFYLMVSRSLFQSKLYYDTMRILFIWRIDVRKLLIAIGVLILVQAYWMIPANMPDALDWILFVVLLLFGAYTIYDARKTAS